METETPVTVGDFTSGQQRFLDFQRNSILLMVVRQGGLRKMSLITLSHSAYQCCAVAQRRFELRVQMLFHAENSGPRSN